MLKWIVSRLNNSGANRPISPPSPNTPSTTPPKPEPAVTSAAPSRFMRPGAVIDRAAIIRQLRLHEGERLKPYRCTAGKLTIGIGRNLEDRGISPAESAFLLGNDIDDHWRELVRALPWVESLDEVRQRVLLDMAFNLGVVGLLNFKNTLGTIQAGDYQKGAAMMLDSRWAKQVGQRADRLAVMMATGKEPRELWPKS